MQKLSKREKILIAVALGIGAIFLLGNFVFIPAYTKYFDTQTKHAEVLSTLEMTKMKLENEAASNENLKSAQAKLEQNKGTYPPLMTNEELDKLITGLCLQHNLKPTLLGMSLLNLETLPVPGETAPTSEENADGEKIESSIFKVATATINANGTYEDLLRFVNTVDQMSYIRMSSIEWSVNKNKTSEETIAPGISIIFEVTMTDISKLQTGS